MKPFPSVLSIACLFQLSLSFSAAAAETQADPYYEIDSVQIRRTDEGDRQWHEVRPEPALSSGFKRNSRAMEAEGTDAISTEKAISTVVNIGKEIWKVVEANKPVVNTTTDTAFALPKGVTSVDQLDSWKGPRTATYQVVYRNRFNMEVVRLEYMVSFEYNGHYQSRGRYVANATVVPVHLKVLLGYKFDANLTVKAVTNQGTEEDPLAAIGLIFHWTVKNPILHNERRAVFTLRGDGSIN